MKNKLLILLILAIVILATIGIYLLKSRVLTQTSEQLKTKEEASETEKEWMVVNPETGEETYTNKPETDETKNDLELSEGDKLLQKACESAVNDYPEWTKASSDIIVWEDAGQGKEKNFYYRNAAEDSSMALDSPAQTSELLTDIDFVDSDKIGYVKKGQKWQIGLFQLNGQSSLIYEMSEQITSMNASFIDKDKFVIFYKTDDQAILKYVNKINSTEETIWETSSIAGENQKVAVSSKGTYVYLLHDNNLRIFELLNKEKIEEFNSVISAVWIGDSNLLYSSSEGSSIYDVKNKNSDKLSKIDSSATDLTFNPKLNGVIAYTSDSKANIINCQDFENLGTYAEGKIEALANEKTVILTKKDLLTSGYWRFNEDWYILLSENFSSFDSHALLATTWSQY